MLAKQLRKTLVIVIAAMITAAAAACIAAEAPSQTSPPAKQAAGDKIDQVAKGVQDQRPDSGARKAPSAIVEQKIKSGALSKHPARYWAPLKTTFRREILDFRARQGE